ncbi:uncharacterized protein LOC5508697 isoform X2 [Nematostella vectensis]|uniref:uncharacterized protein LOC5508697 isoform X2 n=1 Tax=Nematostella vectensis TaxID=45351 RepID=UPI002076E5E1|nr:uncharacterized protein LOC5508697 isoform X2 [Nematostella vectensis]
MTMGRPVESTVIAPDEQRVIIEILLRQPDRRLLELQQEVGRVSGAVYSISAIQYYLRRNGITRKKAKETSFAKGRNQAHRLQGYCMHTRSKDPIFLDKSRLITPRFTTHPVF